jgi:adenine-specific DNA methylase
MGARAGGDTLQGRQAYGVLTWVYEDPQARSAEGRTRVAELARQATGAALTEIQDVATMLARLAGTFQLSGIAGQVLDMAFHPEQRRGPDGRWIKGGGSGLITTQMKSSSGQSEADLITAEHARQIVAEATREMKAEQQQVVGEMVAKVQAVNAKLEAARELAETEDRRKHKAKLAVEGLLAIGSGIVAMVAVRLGLDEMLAVSIPVVPLIIQAVIEFFKRL